MDLPDGVCLRSFCLVGCGVLLLVVRLLEFWCRVLKVHLFLNLVC